MQPEDLSDGRLDEALRRQPRWEPPRHFARAVVARMPATTASRPAPSVTSLRVVFRAALIGAFAASGALVAGLLMSWAALAVLANGVVITTAYEMMLDVATATLVDHATAIAWITALLMMWIAASATGRAQEWI